MKRFISKNSNLRIVLKHGISPEPITGRLAVPGLYVKFKNGAVNISDEEIIKLMMSHGGFNSDFILVNEEETDPWKWQRRDKEPAHKLTELKYGHVEKTLAPKGQLDGMSVEKRMLFEKMVEDTAKKIAVPLAKKMLREVLKENDDNEGVDENSREAVTSKKSEPSVTLNVPENEGTVVTDNPENTEFKCICGKIAKTKAGLAAHQRSCKELQKSK